MLSKVLYCTNLYIMQYRIPTIFPRDAMHKHSLCRYASCGNVDLICNLLNSRCEFFSMPNWNFLKKAEVQNAQKQARLSLV